MSDLKLFFLSFRGHGALHTMARDFGHAVEKGRALGAPNVEAVGGELSFDDPESAFFDAPDELKKAAKDPRNHDRFMTGEELEAMGGRSRPTTRSTSSCRSTPSVGRMTCCGDERRRARMSLMSIRQAARSGIAKIRKPEWKPETDHIELLLTTDGGVGPWATVHAAGVAGDEKIPTFILDFDEQIYEPAKS